MTNNFNMSLERAYKNCQECYEYHSGAEQIIKDKSIKRILNGVNTNEVILGISSLFMSVYLRNEAMKALEGEIEYTIYDQDNDSEGVIIQREWNILKPH